MLLTTERPEKINPNKDKSKKVYFLEYLNRYPPKPIPITMPNGINLKNMPFFISRFAFLSNVGKLASSHPYINSISFKSGLKSAVAEPKILTASINANT